MNEPSPPVTIWFRSPAPTKESVPFAMFPLPGETLGASPPPAVAAVVAASAEPGSGWPARVFVLQPSWPR